MGKFFIILRKKLSPVPWDKCTRWFLDLPYFVMAYQTSKTPSSYLGMLHNDPYSEYKHESYYGSQVIQAASSRPSTVQFISTKVVDSAFFESLYFYMCPIDGACYVW